MKEQRCQLAKGTLQHSAAEVLAAWSRDPARAPKLVWCEPVNGPCRLPKFRGLAEVSQWELPSVALTEARLFYEGGMLHLLADASGTRWAAWWEGDAGIPAWCPSPAMPEDLNLVMQTRPLVLAQPRAMGSLERGLSGAGTGGNAVTAVEYYDQGVLRWWRLTTEA